MTPKKRVGSYLVKQTVGKRGSCTTITLAEKKGDTLSLLQRATQERENIAGTEVR